MYISPVPDVSLIQVSVTNYGINGLDCLAYYRENKYVKHYINELYHSCGGLVIYHHPPQSTDYVRPAAAVMVTERSNISRKRSSNSEATVE